MTVLHTILNFYNAQPPNSTYRSALKLLLANLDKVKSSGIEKLAELCCVSPATMNRLVERIGYDSFRQFRREVANIYDNYPLHNRCFPYSKTAEQQMPDAYFEFLGELMEQLRSSYDAQTIAAICREIHEAETVFLFTDALVTHAKRMLQLDLAVSGKQTELFFAPDDLLDAVNRVKGPCFVVSDLDILSRNIAESFSMLEKISARGIRIMSIVPDTMPQVEKYIDYPIFYRSSRTSLDKLQIDMIVNLVTIRYRALYID